MNPVRHIGILVLVVTLSACGHKGIYSKGYYSGRSSHWPNGVHIVQAGETLYSIAWQYGQDYREVARWNGISSPYTIFPQQQLRMVKPASINQQAAPSVTKVNKPVHQTTVTSRTGTPAEKTDTETRSVSQKLAWQWPARGRIISRFSASEPGQKGIDIAGRDGAKIYAAEAGYVVYSGSGLRGYGKLIIVKHNETFLSAYAHNSNLRVREGEIVKKGEHIADMGRTGTETVKLHFEIRRNGKPVNPFKYLPKL